ncbi:aconitate hydratase 1 [Chthoniobacter flavus Ellin428]|uniref:Aconitate hydratase A n=1 Tax=Chthoniobacter flavus Ellin428 TaxID=497964 RepID=B4CWZ4_9BACT|nr:aconitate hydratase [Chthoniobacter flavus]EDY21314.1 aconitate hydratase 1 [Chthoniobacter flavus Ellin428]TCO84917.1 aconitase [Chthoniobacter flavus]
MSDAFKTKQQFELGSGKQGSFYSLPALEKQGVGPISRLPISIRIVLESVLRNCDGKKVSEQDVKTLANWNAKKPAQVEIPFLVARVVLQDFTGVPLLVDLAAMRSTVERLGRDPKMIEPLVPVDLVVDHSVQVDFFGSAQALELNLEFEFKRNRERYQLLKWGQQAFQTFGVVPPGIGIVHQVNLEYLAKGMLEKDGVYYPDTLVGTDSHTTMINGLGVVGWGVGGIEAEAGMLGQPVYFLTPEVVGVHLTGALKEGVTATDLVLHVTQMLRKAKVVGKFVEFYGPGAKSLPVVDRATIANMAPEYGATMGFFGVDEETTRYLTGTGRSEEHVKSFENYYKAQGLWGIPENKGQIDYSVDLELDISTVVPGVAGPKRPQDRIVLPELGSTFRSLLTKSVPDGGYGKKEADIALEVPVHINGSNTNGHHNMFSTDAAQAKNHLQEGTPQHVSEMITNRPTPDSAADLAASPYKKADVKVGNGSVLIAAITSCTNTSNPSVMLGAGLLAKKAVEKGLMVNPAVKTSLGPGSRVVTDYLTKTGLQQYLDTLGFQTVGYGCTTCIGNSGPLHPALEEAINKNDLVAASVLSGNRNFEARVHQNIKANFLMSPPLVVAFALAGTVDIDLSKDPLGKGKDGQDVFLKDIWPSLKEIREAMTSALKPEVFRKLYTDFANQNPKWNEVPSSVGEVYSWDEKSTYIQEPPFFEGFGMEPGHITEIKGARSLGIFGDSVTTDHISPAGAIKKTSPAGKFLLDNGVSQEDFNSYGSRRGNDRVMTRGTFANVRIKNLMVPGVEGGVTKHQPDGEQMSIYDASMKYQQAGTPLVIFAGHEYGTGSSRDWAAKGTLLLGVKAVIAQSFERIHRSNLCGMGVVPLQFPEGVSAQTLQLDGTETIDVLGLDDNIKPMSDVKIVIHRANGKSEELTVKSRIDTGIEVDYVRHGGILPYVLRQLLGA